MKKYIIYILLVLFLLSAAYFLFLTNESGTVNHPDTSNTVSIDNMPINRVSSNSRIPRSGVGAKALSHASFTTDKYKNEELPNKNDDANASAFTDSEPVIDIDGDTVIVSRDYEIVLTGGISLDIPAGTIIKKADVGTLIHVGPRGLLLVRMDGSSLDFPRNSVLEFLSINSVTDLLEKVTSGDEKNAGRGGAGCDIGSNAILLLILPLFAISGPASFVNKRSLFVAACKIFNLVSRKGWVAVK